MDYSKISIYLTNFITRDLNYDEEKKEVIAYSIENIILQIGGFILIVIISFLFNALIPTIIAAIFGGFLRKVSGGFHFNSPIKCLFFGTFIYTFIGISTYKLIDYGFNNTTVLYLIDFISFLIVYLFAPVDSPAKPIHSISFKKKLKISALIILIISFLIVFITDSIILKISITFGIFYQAITLLPVFNKKEV
jgi:accessory gene regulator B